MGKWFVHGQTHRFGKGFAPRAARVAAIKLHAQDTSRNLIVYHAGDQLPRPKIITLLTRYDRRVREYAINQYVQDIMHGDPLPQFVKGLFLAMRADDGEPCENPDRWAFSP
jgi:hypothetical protein